MTPYETRFSAMKSSLIAVMQGLAEPYEASVEEYVGDDLGYTFSFERSDGELISVTALIEDASDVGFEGRGNIAIRVLGQDETLCLVAPDNRTDDVFADFGDDVAWDTKLTSIQDGATVVQEALAEWVSAVKTGVTP